MLGAHHQCTIIIIHIIHIIIIPPGLLERAAASHAVSPLHAAAPPLPPERTVKPTPRGSV